MIAYDRIGYSIQKHENVLNNIDREVAVLHKAIERLPVKKVILIGYSYGGTIVMANPENYRSKIVLAPSVKGEYEPLYWILNFYKWKLTCKTVLNESKNSKIFTIYIKYRWLIGQVINIHLLLHYGLHKTIPITYNNLLNSVGSEQKMKLPIQQLMKLWNHWFCN